MFNWMKEWVVRLLKQAAVYAVQTEGDRLQERLRAGIAKDGPAAIDRNIDDFQAKVGAAVHGWGPKWRWLENLRAQIGGLVQDFGDKLQAKLKKEVAEYGPSAVDRVFDAAQATLLKKIEELKI